MAVLGGEVEANSTTTGMGMGMGFPVDVLARRRCRAAWELVMRFKKVDDPGYGSTSFGGMRKRCTRIVPLYGFDKRQLVHLQYSMMRHCELVMCQKKSL